MSEKYAEHDAYSDPATGVLKNLLNIKEQSLLEKVESEFSSYQAFQLYINPLKDAPFDSNSLCSIHYRLFKDVFEWAGKYRTVDISKGGNRFAHVHYIQSSLDALFKQLKEENGLQGLDASLFSQRSAFYMAELNAIHPFREGNGRTQREFLNQLAYRNNMMIEWTKIPAKEILKATIESYSGNTRLLIQLIENNLTLQ